MSVLHAVGGDGGVSVTRGVERGARECLGVVPRHELDVQGAHAVGDAAAAAGVALEGDLEGGEQRDEVHAGLDARERLAVVLDGVGRDHVVDHDGVARGDALARDRGGVAHSELALLLGLLVGEPGWR
jgi:hypothetical protein